LRGFPVGVRAKGVNLSGAPRRFVRASGGSNKGYVRCYPIFGKFHKVIRLHVYMFTLS